MIGLYSKRFSPWWGWHWQHERDCRTETAHGWLAIFSEDEPAITFVLSTKNLRNQRAD